MTIALKNPIKAGKKLVNKTAVGILGKAKWAARGIYTLIPCSIYSATVQKVSEIEALNWFPKLIAKIFFRDDLNKLYGAHEIASKGMGYAGAYLATAVTDDLIGRVIQGGEKRRALEITATAALTSATNAGANAVQGGNLDAFLQAYSSPQNFGENLIDTGVNLYRTLTSYQEGGDVQNMLRGAAAGLAGLTIWKAGEILVPYIAKMKDRFVVQKACKRVKALEKELEN